MLIAGTQSGCGKTSVTLALMQYLRGQGLVVAPFKAGPDFLDPMWHAVACDRTPYNLDTRMMGAEACRALFADKVADADVAVIEGVMGLFDGAQGVGGEGSSAHLAQVLGAPVLLVVDAKGMSGSLVALVEGFVARAEAMGVTVAGIIANRVGSVHHAQILEGLLNEHHLPPLVAWMAKNAPPLAERHLGLVMPESEVIPDFSAVFHVVKDVFTTEAQRHGEARNLHVVGELLAGVTVAVARDAAFCFIYAANVEWLRTEGAAVLFFSPLAGDPVPEGADALWLPGGYPELHTQALSASESWGSLRALIEAGKPVLAECGGMMVLGEAIDGVAMAGVLPCAFKMQEKLAGLGYREDASGVRGHEFHHSSRESFTTEARRHGGIKEAFSLSRGDAGLRYKNLRASYIHWYFSSQPKEVASWLLT